MPIPFTFQMRDAHGRRVSLLNDDQETPDTRRRPSLFTFTSYHPRAPPANSTPATPELLRSDSYDSYRLGEPASPVTPHYESGFRYPPASGIRSPRDGYYPDGPPAYAGVKRRFSDFSEGQSVSYEDDQATFSPTSASFSGTESSRTVKRFPCRYRGSHGCEKTFTTSGHASRHSKIHTAEKAVPCSFDGCTKKFTRADNMKQHLETHFKEKPRSSTTRQPLPPHKRRCSRKSPSLSSSATHPGRTITTAPVAAAPAMNYPGGPHPYPGTMPSNPPDGPSPPTKGPMNYPEPHPYPGTMPSKPPGGPSSPTKGLDALAMAALREEAQT
ncbi:hypothetical protein C8A01DRAFT_15596 [Parachaetomium inaequale]|uniref:C2H2 type master regulator of conidiophore development brlA n=1 Tax=Parachaetomium inaequale TaxID=2588326 RepID=A0AAN6PGG0_9PEZI|nr:hypothetical protein C8A01DRAFT_15596 [Parachaetomium inaequale]